MQAAKRQVILMVELHRRTSFNIDKGISVKEKKDLLKIVSIHLNNTLETDWIGLVFWRHVKTEIELLKIWQNLQKTEKLTSERKGLLIHPPIRNERLNMVMT